ncbi:MULTISPECIES: hypothetical protein [unclassified Ensifer]|uniref:hypothetical protein n=1 Tax=unclassified Ensifer TaxID=2633371 RepID=UPI000B7CF104|nr:MULTISPECIES: hypothetical protein [unclassified Ensifer]MBD9597517.1 hypothetical protein [Ensifer sp. ENS05]MBD9624913.1 hypothetical protein [Ensifer sp. ENS06]
MERNFDISSGILVFQLYGCFACRSLGSFLMDEFRGGVSDEAELFEIAMAVRMFVTAGTRHLSNRLQSLELDQVEAMARHPSWGASNKRTSRSALCQSHSSPTALV